MRRIFLVLVILAVQSVMGAADSLKMFFIGNSYTSMTYSIPKLVQWMSSTYNEPVSVSMSVKGGSGWDSHWNSDNLARDGIKSAPWDYVVLQDYSDGTSSGRLPNFKKYGTLLYEYAMVNSPADVMFYLTWSYESSPPVYDSINKVWLPSMQDYVTREYLNIATELDGMVSPVGMAHGLIRRERPDVDLWADGTHPSPVGAYLAAGVFTSALFGIDPMTLPRSTTVKNAYLPAIDSSLEYYVKGVIARTIVDTVVTRFLPEPSPLTKILIESPFLEAACFDTLALSLNMEYADHSVRNYNSRGHYRSLTPEIANVDFRGRLVTFKEGLARILAFRKQASDTITIGIGSPSASCDSIQFSATNVPLLVGNGYNLDVRGFFQKAGKAYNYVLHPGAVRWTTLDNRLLSVDSLGNVLALATGSAVIMGELMGKRDTCRFAVNKAPDIVRRFNFQNVPTSMSYGWEAISWYKSVGDDIFKWTDRAIDNVYADRKGTNFLLKTMIYVSKGKFVVPVPDGEYIIKAAIGDNVAGKISTPDWLMYGSDTLLKNAGPQNSFIKDTLTAAGGNGLAFNSFGALDYLVVISNQGIDIDSVAWDNGVVVPLATPQESSVQTVAQSLGLLVYPNPLKTFAKVAILGRLKNQQASISLFDIKGRKMDEVNLNANQSYLTWNASKYPAGIYIMILRQGTRTVSHKVIVLK